MKKGPDPRITRGTNNVFADLGFPDAETHLLKAELVTRIQRVITAQELTQIAAAKRMGLSQPDVSRLLNGHFRDVSVERLMRLLTRLGCDVDITVRNHGKAAAQRGNRQRYRPGADEADLPIRAKLCPRQPRPARGARHPRRSRTRADGGRRTLAGRGNQSGAAGWPGVTCDEKYSLFLWRHTEAACRRIVSRGAAAFPRLRTVMSTSQPSRVSSRIWRSTGTSRNCPLSSRDTSG